MTDKGEVVYRPACQARTPAECSGCNMNYDCVRARSGRLWAWPLVALALVGVLAMVLK